MGSCSTIKTGAVVGGVQRADDQNPEDAPKMVKTLSQSGFSVTRLPMSVLTEQDFSGWLEDVRESWDERNA